MMAKSNKVRRKARNKLKSPGLRKSTKQKAQYLMAKSNKVRRKARNKQKSPGLRKSTKQKAQ